MLRGWAGKRLRIDLSERNIIREHISSDYLHSWVGGRGFNADFFSQEAQPGIDPFNPDTPFCLAVGPLTGSCAPCAANVCVASRSPLLEPHTYATTSMGGHWGAELKFAGYDQIVIVGKASKPTYILIDGGKVKIKDGTYLWGKDTSQTAILIQEELKDRNIQVLCIGPAGERLVRYASLVNSFFWDSGRLGLGAVLGSKNVKAIAIRGSNSVSVADPDRFITICQRLMNRILKDPGTQRLSSEGTLFSIGHLDENVAQYINSKYYHEHYFFRKEGCFSCPINCGRYTYVKSGPFGGSHFGGVRGEGVMALGPEIGNLQWDSILKMIQLCILYGIDPVSTGGAIAWAMTSFDKGLLTERETDGLSLRFGKADVALELVTQIVQRRGFGDVLAEGAFRASKIIGKGTEDLLLHIKGLEISCLNSLNLRTALNLAVSTCDWDYLKSSVNVDGEGMIQHISDNLSKAKNVAEFIKRREDVKCAADLLGICSFPYARLPALSPSDMIEQLTAVTGISMEENDLLKLSKKVIDQERTMVGREGIGREDEVCLQKLFEQENGERAHETAEPILRSWESSLSEYYALRGWDPETGIPAGCEHII